MTLCSFEHNVI